MIKKIILAFTALPLLLSALSLQAQQADIENGHRIYDHWCTPCHAPGPKHPGTQALNFLYKGSKPAVLEQRSDLTVDIVSSFVRNGVSVMAPFRKTEISDQELLDLATYVSTAAERNQ